MAWLAIILLFGSDALAFDFDQARSELSQRNAKIEYKLRSLGVGQVRGGSEDLFSDRKKKAHPVFTLHDSLSNTSLAPGDLLFTRLINRLVVGGEDSPAIVEVLPGNRLGALTGMRLLGIARQSSTEGRISIEFTRLVERTGNFTKLNALALDDSGAYGLRAEVFSQRALMVAGAMASSFLSGYAASQQSQNTNSFGFSQTAQTGRNALLQGVAQAAADQGRRLIEKETEEKPVLVLSEGTEIVVFLNEELVL